MSGTLPEGGTLLEVRRKRRERSSTPRFRVGRKVSLYALYLTAAGLLVAGGLAVYSLRPAANADNLEMISVGQGFVRNAIREELKTSFSGEDETRVERLPDRKFLVAGWVDVISEEGETERQDFSCVIYKSDDNWVGEKISVIPQHL